MKKELISALAITIISTSLICMDQTSQNNAPTQPHVHPSRQKNIRTPKRVSSSRSITDEPKKKKARPSDLARAFDSLQKDHAALTEQLRQETRRVERLRRRNNDKLERINHMSRRLETVTAELEVTRSDLDTARTREEIAYEECKASDKARTILEKEIKSLKAQLDTTPKNNRSTCPWGFIPE